MTFESREGTRLATSPDGLTWQSQGLLVDRSGADVDRFGHVTPFLLVEPESISLFAGAASSASWDHNRIVRVPLSAQQRARVGIR